MIRKLNLDNNIKRKEYNLDKSITLKYNLDCGLMDNLAYQFLTAFAMFTNENICISN